MNIIDDPFSEIERLKTQLAQCQQLKEADNVALKETEKKLAQSEASRLGLRKALRSIYDFWKNTDTPMPYFIGDATSDALTADAQVPNALLGVLRGVESDLTLAVARADDYADSYCSAPTRAALAKLRAATGKESV